MTDLEGGHLFDNGMKLTGKSCAVVGNSGKLLSQNFGAKIDSHDNVIRCNLAVTDGFEKYVGQKTNIRMANCHLFHCTKNDPKYLRHLHEVFPNFDKHFLSKQRNTKIIVKPNDVDRSEFRSYISKIEANDNEVAIIHPDFYEICCKRIGTKDATTGILAIIIACAVFETVSCFGFTFYDQKYEKHYYEKMPPVNHPSHNLDSESKFIKNLVDEGKITWH